MVYSSMSDFIVCGGKHDSTYKAGTDHGQIRCLMDAMAIMRHSDSRLTSRIYTVDKAKLPVSEDFVEFPLFSIDPDQTVVYLQMP